MRLKLRGPKTDVFIPDGSSVGDALARTTHLCIAAHQDDIEIMAQHGISECFARKDRWFSGVVVTDGAGSPRAGPYSGCSGARMRTLRRLEQRKAAFIGGYSAVVQLGYPSSAAKDPADRGIAEDLLSVLTAAKPEVLYVHDPADTHDTHVAVLLKCVEALGRLPRAKLPRRMFGCEVWRSLGWLAERDRRALPVSDRPNLAAALLGVFDSQLSGGKRYDLATLGRRAANATFHEARKPDKRAAVTYAMDLGPLLAAPRGRMADALRALVADHADRFKADVLGRLGRLSGRSLIGP